MDFKQHQADIKNYIESNLPSVLQECNLADFDSYIDDFIDLDKYTKSKQLFYSFDYYNYEDISNESNVEDFTFSVLLVFRKGKDSELKENMLNYASAFYRMFELSGNNMKGVADYGIIQNVQFYPFAEGYPEVKIAELTIHLYTER